MLLSPSESQTQISLVAFLQSILPSGTEVIEGQDNRVSEPQGTDFVVFTAIRRERSSTNIDTAIDCAFTASIAATTLTVTAMLAGTIATGTFLLGPSILANTLIVSQLTGTPGGVGTYSLNASQNVSSQTMAAGVLNITQPTEITFQLDVHGPSSADNAQVISTLFRDPVATEFFAAQPYDVSPLYADNPRQVPFTNENQQVETRWIVEACVQANQSVLSIPQMFAAALSMAGLNLANHR